MKFADLLSQGSTLVEFRLDKMYEAGFSEDELAAAELMASDLIDRYRRSLTFWEWLKIMPYRPRLGFGMRRRLLAPGATPTLSQAPPSRTARAARTPDL